MKTSQKTASIAAVALAIIVILMSRIGREATSEPNLWDESETRTDKTYNLAWWNPEGVIFNSTINADDRNIALNEVAVNGQNVTLAENGLYAYNALEGDVPTSAIQLGSLSNGYSKPGSSRCFFPSISPDGTYIACLYLGKIWTIDTATGEISNLNNESLDVPGAPTAYNKVIVYPYVVGNQSSLRVIDKDTGKILETLRGEQHPAFNKSGSHYALLARGYTRGEYYVVWYTNIGNRVRQSDKLMLGESISDVSLVAISDFGDYALLRTRDAEFDSLVMVDIRNAKLWVLDNLSANAIINADFSSDDQHIAWVRDGMVYIASDGLEGEAFYVAEGVRVRWIE